MFTYGTLEIEQVMRAVTRKRFAARPARLEGYARFLMVGQHYPGIVAKRGHSTTGTLYLDIDQTTLGRIDRFEGRDYRRRPVMVYTEDGERLRAWTYVIQQHRRRLLSPQPWDRERFVRKHLGAFLTSLKQQH
ncbi:MAG: gamma-glutamylcyclotransferase [Pseudomonadota bacterium]|nr:MAG: gamma-glutamylcyclotransferase [Pseudomonadota bacterium]